MNVLWLHAHPEPRSLTGTLRTSGVTELERLGHQVRHSDLYAMNWKPVVDGSDYCTQPSEDPLVVTRASQRAHREGTLSADIQLEQEKLNWADAVVLGFPLWWFGMPAILKGWFDRVFVKGYAYGVMHPGRPGRSLRYGEGPLSGKRALAIVTTGGPEAVFGPRGINGPIEDLLFPLLHGTFWYAGIDALPPLVVHGADRVSADELDRAEEALHARLRDLDSQPPLPYRTQNHGDYDDQLVLRAEHAAEQSGFGVHLHACTRSGADRLRSA